MRSKRGVKRGILRSKSSSQLPGSTPSNQDSSAHEQPKEENVGLTNAEEKPTHAEEVRQKEPANEPEEPKGKRRRNASAKAKASASPKPRAKAKATAKAKAKATARAKAKAETAAEPQDPAEETQGKQSAKRKSKSKCKQIPTTQDSIEAAKKAAIARVRDSKSDVTVDGILPAVRDKLVSILNECGGAPTCDGHVHGLDVSEYLDAVKFDMYYKRPACGLRVRDDLVKGSDRDPSKAPYFISAGYFSKSRCFACSLELAKTCVPQWHIDCAHTINVSNPKYNLYILFASGILRWFLISLYRCINSI